MRISDWSSDVCSSDLPALLSTSNGFDAAIYQNDQGQYVVAYRGTDNWGVANPGDADDNALQGMGFETGQYSDAIALAQRAEQVFGEGNVVVTGHSLGGGLASAAALATGASGATFHAAGLSNETLERSEERRVGQECADRVDLGGRR